MLRTPPHSCTERVALRRGAVAVLAVAALASPVAPARAGDPPPADADPSARAAQLADLVWKAVDAPEADAGRAIADVAALPSASWTDVAAVLRAGRRYSALPPPPAASDDAAHAAYFAAFPWKIGEVRRYDLGDAPGHWYSVVLPEGYDGTRPVPVWFDFGLFSEGAPPGFAAVRLHPGIPAAFELGTARMSMTAGFAIQSIVLSVVADLERRFHADRDRVFCGGFSRTGNTAWYEAVHWPDLWAGVATASGYYEFDEALLPNLAHVAVLAASGDDPGHKASNEFTARTAKRLVAARHPDVTVHSPKGRAIEGISEVFLPWVATRVRDPLPRAFTYVLVDPRHRGAYWAEIVAVKTTGPLRTVVIGAPGDTTAERFDVHSRPASVAVEATAADAVTVRATNAAEVRIFLSPDLFDLTKPLRVTVGGRTTAVTPAPSVATLLANFRRDGDRARLFPAEIRIRGDTVK